MTGSLEQRGGAVLVRQRREKGIKVVADETKQNFTNENHPAIKNSNVTSCYWRMLSLDVSPLCLWNSAVINNKKHQSAQRPSDYTIKSLQMLNELLIGPLTAWPQPASWCDCRSLTVVNESVVFVWTEGAVQHDPGLLRSAEDLREVFWPAGWGETHTQTHTHTLFISTIVWTVVL